MKMILQKHLDEIEKKLIKAINLRGLPIGYQRSEADSYWTIIVNKDKSLTCEGYAEYLKAKTIEDLDIVELSYILLHGVTGEDLDELLGIR